LNESWKRAFSAAARAHDEVHRFVLGERRLDALARLIDRERLEDAGAGVDGRLRFLRGGARRGECDEQGDWA
jgi:hypothetical protein